MNQLAAVFSALSSSLLLSLSGSAIESWADSKLSVTNGLELWFDASREPAARQVTGIALLGPGALLDFWHDASGHGRDLNQRVRSARPQFRRMAGTAFLHFDGENDFLAGTASLPLQLSNATVILFAAPATNAGGFCGLLSCNQKGRSDYQSGFNLDLGSGASTNWNRINLEAAGASGERNLLTNAVSFGAFHTLAAVVDAQEVRVNLNGHPEGKRSRKPAALFIDELTVGARNNDSTGGSPDTHGFFAGEIAEILVYDRALPFAELDQIEMYLAQKYAALKRAFTDPTAPIEKSLVTVSNPPPIQMLVPGFLVRELPLQLNNINNLVYSPDGRLFALGYDGNVFQLKDTDGDGLEDTASYFYKNDYNEIPATIGMAWGPGGLDMRKLVVREFPFRVSLSCVI